MFYRGSSVGSNGGGSGGSVKVDGTTINKNASNELQTIGVINPQTETALKIWNGTQEQWNQGEESTYYGWLGNDFNWSAVTLPSSQDWIGGAYGNGKFVIVANTSDKAAYSTDGENWTEVTLPYRNWNSVIFANGKFVAVASSGKGAYSTDGVNWTGIVFPTESGYTAITYGNGKFVAVGDSAKPLCSTDGENWIANTQILPLNSQSIAYGNGKFVTCDYDGNLAYSTDGENWTVGTTGGIKHAKIIFGDKFVIVPYGTNEGYYSTDGENWTSMTLPSSRIWYSVAYGNGCYVAISATNDSYAYSLNGIDWFGGSFSDNKERSSIMYGNNSFFAFTFSSDQMSKSSTSPLAYYTDVENPTTESTVYSEPGVSSELTITATGEGTITLSDTVTYTYTSSLNQTSYQSIGETHPDWLCFINGVGIKIGTTVIATASTVDQVYNASSTNAQSGVAVASGISDTLGTIETALSEV